MTRKICSGWRRLPVFAAAVLAGWAVGADAPSGPKPRLDPDPGRFAIVEPYAWLHGGAFRQAAPPESPDPLAGYVWDAAGADTPLQVYSLLPAAVRTDSPSSFSGLESLVGDAPSVRVNGPGSIRVDFGVVSAAWLEMQSPDLDGDVDMSISEYAEPAEVNWGPAHPRKTSGPIRHGNVYRLELNEALFEGVRFGWVHVRSFRRSWMITGLRLVCLVKPVNYAGKFSCSDPELERIWHTGAYSVRVNFGQDDFGALLMDRSDRLSWTGDAYPAQAASLVAFSNYEFIRRNIVRTSDEDNGIPGYGLLWVLGLIDYFRYSGDRAALESLTARVDEILDAAGRVYDAGEGLAFTGWDERLGAGFENPDARECVSVFRMLYLRVCREWAAVLEKIGRAGMSAAYSNQARIRQDALRSGPGWHSGWGAHAVAEAILAGALTAAEGETLFARELAEPSDRLSFSPFNQFFILQALARAGRFDEGAKAARDHWGGQIRLGGTTFFEVYRPDWNDVLAPNDPVPNGQCGYTSLAHSWGAGVTQWLTEEILGIKPVEPGFAEVQILPRLNGFLTRVAGAVSTPRGEIRAEFDAAAGRASVVIPPDTRVRVGIPKAGNDIRVVFLNGRPAWTAGFRPVSDAEGVGETADHIVFQADGPRTLGFVIGFRPGEAVPPLDPGSPLPAEFLSRDETTAGDWGGRYGSDGYVLFNYDGSGGNVRSLPAYIQSVVAGKGFAIRWAKETSDRRALARDKGNGFPRNASGIKTGDPIATYQTATLDIVLSSPRAFRAALYLVDFDRDGRRTAVELFDLDSRKTVAPVQIVDGYGGGVYLVFRYDRSVRVRINHVRGTNAVVSGIFFDPPGR